MKTEVLLEKVSDNRFRASGSGRFALTVEGNSRENALLNFEKAAAELISPDAEIVTVEIPAPQHAASAPHPWAWFAGIARNDPHYPAFLEQIEANRQSDEQNEATKTSE